MDGIVIKKKDHDDVLHCYWQMMKQCEQDADHESDSTLKTQVECYFRLWNRITGDACQPSWVIKRLAQEAGQCSV